jgi:chemotaxis protein MotB
VARKKTEEEHENAERWLLTYSDLITLLLAFFIVMYSMSKVDAKKFGAVQMALSSVLHGGSSAWEGRTPGLPTDDKRQNLLDLDDLRHLQMRLGKSVRQQQKQGKGATDITTEIDERGLIIHVKENAFFQSGQADLTPAAQSALDAIAEVIQGIDNFIRVEGHTDNVPINTVLFPSNWELSTARATQVVRYFLSKYNFAADRISVSGYAEYRPIAPNDTPENRARNRRVDIVILAAKRGTDEPLIPDGAVPGLVKPTDRIKPHIPVSAKEDSIEVNPVKEDSL